MPVVETLCPTMYDYVYFACQLMFIFDVPNSYKKVTSIIVIIISRSYKTYNTC